MTIKSLKDLIKEVEKMRWKLKKSKQSPNPYLSDFFVEKHNKSIDKALSLIRQFRDSVEREKIRKEVLKKVDKFYCEECEGRYGIDWSCAKPINHTIKAINLTISKILGDNKE